MIKKIDKRQFIRRYRRNLPSALVLLIRKIDEIALQVNKNTKAVKK